MAFFLKEGEIINGHSHVTSANSVRALVTYLQYS